MQFERERDFAFSCPVVVFHTWTASFISFSRGRGEEGRSEPITFTAVHRPLVGWAWDLCEHRWPTSRAR